MSWLSDKFNNIFIRITWNIGWLDYDASKDKARCHPVVPEGSVGGSQKTKLEDKNCNMDGREEAKQNGD